MVFLPVPSARVFPFYLGAGAEVIHYILEEELSMETYGLEKLGITGIKEIVYNPSYEQLFEA